MLARLLSDKVGESWMDFAGPLDFAPRLGLGTEPRHEVTPGNRRWHCALEDLLAGLGPERALRFWHSQDLAFDSAALRTFFSGDDLPKPRLGRRDLEESFGKERLIEWIVDGVLNLDGRAIIGPDTRVDIIDRLQMVRSVATRVLLARSGRDYAASEVAAFVRAHLEEVRAALESAFVERLQSDVGFLSNELSENPNLSLSEIRRGLVEGHFTKSYVAQHCRPILDLSRPIDRKGDHPNLLLAIHLTDAMLRAPVGWSLGELVERFIEVTPELTAVWPDFGPGDVESLQRIYPFIPRWPCAASTREQRKNVDSPDLRLLSPEQAELLHELRVLPIRSRLLSEHDRLRAEGPVLAGREVMTVELATHDVVGYLNHLIETLGADGKHTTVVFKYTDGESGGADSFFPSLCESMFGIRSIIPSSAEELTATVEQELRSTIDRALSENRPLAAHFLGVQDWTTIERLIEAHPELRPLIVGHTSSDADAFERCRIPIVDMANSSAKRIYEREILLADAFQATLVELEKALGTGIAKRTFLIHGMGRIVGPALLRALDRYGVAPGQIFVSDPDLATSVRRHPAMVSRRSLEERGLRIVSDPELVPSIFSRPLVSINATPNDVLTERMIEAVSPGTPLVHFQVGSNVKDRKILRTLSARSDGSIDAWPETRIGRQVIQRYRIRGSEDGPARHVLLPADGRVLNHAFRRLLPTRRTDFINLLKVESWYQAAWNLEQGLHGPQTLGSVGVGFDESGGGLPIVLMLSRDSSAQTLSESDFCIAAANSGPSEELVLALAERPAQI